MSFVSTLLSTRSSKTKFEKFRSILTREEKCSTMDKHQYEELIRALTYEDVDAIVDRLESLKRRCYDSDAFQKGNDLFYFYHSINCAAVHEHFIRKL